MLRHLYISLLKPVVDENVGLSRRYRSSFRRIEKLLIANRGEIACRIIRSAKRLGIRTVAVYSDADAKALHVSMADEAYNIGPPSASESYLRADKILEIAQKSRCQAIHPGYGFLSENIEFAELCQKKNVIFIGPPASAIRDMGIKSTSKAIMSDAGVPVIEGYHGEDQNVDKLLQEARRIGFPVMIKAVRGGGGKGMRVSNSENDFKDALESAKTESQKAFGDSAVLIEKFISEPRHVEVQVFSDHHGNNVHLYERDCSVQRRHQKVIEEAPAPNISENLRQKLGLTAVTAAKAVGYVGAGTVEFILDKKTEDFYFMEMNTRLQVEHPVTEMITGFDLVEWQIKVAQGEKLPKEQEEITARGHAFEARIYAESPKRGFLPGAGPLLHLTTPSPSEDVRIETGTQQGDEVSVYYDPMIAKLVVWGKDRFEALSKLKRSLLDYNIAGLDTNVDFMISLAAHPEFVKGNVHTNFINDHGDSLLSTHPPTETQIGQTALALALKFKQEEHERAVEQRDQSNPFNVEDGFRVNYNNVKDMKLESDGTVNPVIMKQVDNGRFSISCDEGKSWKTMEGVIVQRNNKFILDCIIDGSKCKYNVFKNDDIIAVFTEDGKLEFSLPVDDFSETEDSSGSKEDKVVSPMPGVLDKVLVKPGDEVKEGDALFVLIAMKMEYVVKANRDVKIESVFYKPGDNVAKDAVIVKFEAEKENV
ncbi:unnamed protein product [Acanthoscelides obtectus]|uniref:Methylcrotonoyl-CoA carboxylase subunit alpha, mitochondrial n=2 Tax=Acanthoscelides obtectus TaxID=200917 RepID=A0A9P0KZY2_ACAOB|nr:unnamed protein product [Acanthoscelides obtectus]CAK1630114.1 Methylcrotonoyl-CoA carboxylase subunit alpha, mitochondrial [Acanthoscelides obtectus]